LDFFGGMNYFWARHKSFMNPLICQTILLAGFFTGVFGFAAQAQNLDQIGVTLLRTQTTNLDGTGIRVAQVEANLAGTNVPSLFEVNPGAVNQPTNRFTYFSAAGTANTFTNSVGNESGHADGVAANFYGLTGSGVATNVAHVDNYDADAFIQGYLIGGNYVFNLPATNINDPVVNQSFIFTGTTTNEQQAIDTTYDNYAALYRTLFVSGAGNGGSVGPPATSYNGLGVGAYGGSSSTGPTLDNGRCKPDITAPAGVTSYSTPQVSGAAAVLLQAARRGDGGGDTNSAADIRTVKALLLNGAVKPADWTNAVPSPLDYRYGAGVLNVFNSYKQLAGGKRVYVVATTVATGGAHPPTGATGTIPVLNGWDFNTNTSGKFPTQFDAVNHYYFNVTNGVANSGFTLTATLVWNRQQNKSDINDLNLFLYDCANGNLVACSTSLVDNVEHIFVPQLPPTRYDLQVWKAGGLGIVSGAESYALAFALNASTLTAIPIGNTLQLSWPVYPAGFCVEATTNLASPTWSTNNLSATLTGSTNILTWPATNAAQFFRLRQPNF
jgi:hypothetical protein